MSIKFESTGWSAPQYLVARYAADQRLAGRPVSVTLWLYAEAAPTGGDTWTIWWFGEQGATGNYLVLEAAADGSSAVSLVASLVGQTTLGPVTKSGVATGAWHCVSVVVQAGQGQGSTKLTLYVDGDTSPPSASATTSGVTYPSWDTFALAANLSDGVGDPGFFLAEQIAIWTTALGQFDTLVMHGDRTPPWDVSPFPDFSYWVAAGHSRAGSAVPRFKTWKINRGELFNQSSESADDPLPQLDVPGSPSLASRPTWRAATPALYYATSETIEPVDRPPSQAGSSRASSSTPIRSRRSRAARLRLQRTSGL